MKIAVFLAEGFEEIEALTVVDYARRVDIGVDMVSIEDSRSLIGAHGIEVKADKLISEIDSDDYQGLIIPGGLPGATNLRDDSRVIDLVKKMDDQDKLLAAICAGPIVFAKADIIDSRDMTSYPGFEEELASANYKEDNVVVDGNMITARGPAIAVEFALEIVRYLLDDKKVEELAEDILFPMLMR